MIDAGSIIAADGMLYCFAFNGEFALVEPSIRGFKVMGSMQIAGKRPDHWAHPVIYKGILYIRYANELLAYNIKQE